MVRADNQAVAPADFQGGNNNADSLGPLGGIVTGRRSSSPQVAILGPNKIPGPNWNCAIGVWSNAR